MGPFLGKVVMMARWPTPSCAVRVVSWNVSVTAVKPEKRCGSS